MFSLEVFVFESGDGTEQEFLTLDAEEARRHAQEHRLRCKAMLFEYTDSQPFCDFTDLARPERSLSPCPC